MKKKIIRATTVDGSLGFIEPLLPYLKEKFDVHLLSTGGEKLDRLCDDYDVIGHPVYMYRRMSPIKDIGSLYKIIKIFYKEKPDIVHSITPKAGLLCMIAAWITRVPHRIHTFTGLIWPTSSGIKRKILMLMDWIICVCATQIIPEGKGVMDDLQNYIIKKPMYVLGYGNIKGVDMHFFSRRPEVIERSNSIRDANKFTFIYVGRIVRDKGINELISAFTRLNTKFTSTRLILVGKYEHDLDPIDTASDEIIKNHPAIEYVGPQFKEDLLAYYVASDCFVFPSYREGFPNVVLEAGAMGLPCIVTNINGSREIIIDGENGLITPSKDSLCLYEAMQRIIMEKDLCQEMSKKTRKLIADRFEQSFVQKCQLDFYNSILI